MKTPQTTKNWNPIVENFHVVFVRTDKIIHSFDVDNEQSLHLAFYVLPFIFRAFENTLDDNGSYLRNVLSLFVTESFWVLLYLCASYTHTCGLMGTLQRYNKYLTNLIFLVRTVSYGSCFFPLGFMARALCAWAINLSQKNSVHNLQYGPRTRLVRGIYYNLLSYAAKEGGLITILWFGRHWRYKIRKLPMVGCVYFL